METINRNIEWFTSDEGLNAINTAADVKQRVNYLHGYLKAFCKKHNKNYDENILFKFSFIFSDALFESGLEFAKAPNILDPEKNPFLKYIQNSGVLDNFPLTYVGVLAIMAGIADPQDKKGWIYSYKLKDRKALTEKLDEIGKRYIKADNSLVMPSSQCYSEIDKKYETILIEWVWLFNGEV